eukprot:scaffold63683_cov24-Tisochrysis_lutea.AAC.1
MQELTFLPFLRKATEKPGLVFQQPTTLTKRLSERWTRAVHIHSVHNREGQGRVALLKAAVLSPCACPCHTLVSEVFWLKRRGHSNVFGPQPTKRRGKRRSGRQQMCRQSKSKLPRSPSSMKGLEAVCDVEAKEILGRRKQQELLKKSAQHTYKISRQVDATHPKGGDMQ